jgi:hypothetical protein
MAPKKKINRADYMFKEQEGQTLVKNPGVIDGMQFAIKDLNKCEVHLFDHTSQVGTQFSCIFKLHFCIKNHTKLMQTKDMLQADKFYFSCLLTLWF